MPNTFFKDGNKKDSAMRLAFIIFIANTVLLMVVIAALLVRDHLSGGEGMAAFNDTLKWLTTGGLGGFLAKLAQKYLEKKDNPQKQPIPELQKEKPELPFHEETLATPPAVVNKPLSTYRSIPDKNLTPNFRLYEILESSPIENPEFVRLNWLNIKEYNHTRGQHLAEYLQWIRNLVNEKYATQNDGQNIPLVVTSAFRCFQWEIIKHRDGSSHHAKSLAADWYPKTKSIALSAKILKELHREWESTVYGHQGGLAIKFPSYDKKGYMVTCGFIHTDLGPKRRWIYS